MGQAYVVQLTTTDDTTLVPALGEGLRFNIGSWTVSVATLTPATVTLKQAGQVIWMIRAQANLAVPSVFPDRLDGLPDTPWIVQTDVATGIVIVSIAGNVEGA